MKILIISRSFYPMNSPRSFRTTELVKEFSRKGHEVILLTHKQDNVHIPFEDKYNVKIEDLGKSKIFKIDITKGNKFSILCKRLIKRMLLQLIEYPNIELMFQVRNKLKAKESIYDLLISIAVPFPIHWGVAWSRNKNNRIAKVWVADCGDPFYYNIHDSFKKFFYFKYIEKWYSRKTDYISIPFEGLKKYFFKEFESKYRVIPQGFNFDNTKIYDKPIKNDVVTFAYAGGFIKTARDPKKFLDFLVTKNTPFKFIVYNKQKEFTEPYNDLLGDKLVVKDYIPRKELLYELSKMDFLVNLEYDPENQSPSKLIDYSFTKRPILLIKNNEFYEHVVDEFLSRNYKNKFEMIDIDQYNIENVGQQFLNLVQKE